MSTVGTLARAPREVAVGGVARNFEEPGAKQSMIANLSGSSVNREHYLLCQIFGNGVFVALPPEEGNQLRRDGRNSSLYESSSP